jgi:hypothetical protein
MAAPGSQKTKKVNGLGVKRDIGGRNSVFGYLRKVERKREGGEKVKSGVAASGSVGMDIFDSLLVISLFAILIIGLVGIQNQNRAEIDAIEKHIGIHMQCSTGLSPKCMAVTK